KLILVRLPPGRARLAIRPSLTGSSAEMKTIGIEVVANLAASDAPATVVITALAHEIGRQFREPIKLVLGPAVVDRQVLPVDVARLLQTKAKRPQPISNCIGR